MKIRIIALRNTTLRSLDGGAGPEEVGASDMGDGDRGGGHRGAISLLFTDIEGSSACWDRDPAAMRVSLELHDQILRDAAARHGGHVFSSGGDGFGVAFERASAAVEAARDGQLALTRAEWPAGMPLRVRMGVHTGAVEHRDGNYFGPAVNRAARVAGAGHGGQILLSAVTAALVDADLDLVDLGTFALRGLDEPERIWWLPVPEVHGGEFPPLRSARAGAATPPPLPTRLRFDGDPSFAGRARALEQLAGAWRSAQDGSSPVVLVSGEPGIGKTRLVAQAATRIHDAGGTVLYGRCDPDAAVPHGPFAEALSGLTEGLDPAAARQLLATHGGELSRLVPRLSLMVPGLSAPIDGEASGNRHRLFRAVSEVLGGAAEAGPGLVLVIDDFHWADPSTIALLHHLSVSAAPRKVLVVVVYRHTDVTRSGPVEQALTTLRRSSGATVVPLGGLTRAEVQAYVTNTAGHELGELAPVVTDLYARTGGNPFFIGELIRHLVDTQAASFDGGRWTVGDIGESGIPQGVRELVRQRLHSLPEATTAVLEAAAAFGEEFDVRFVARACALDVPPALAALEPAIDHGLVREVGRGRFAFVHLLLRTALHDDVPAARRVCLHVDAARAIEELGNVDLHWPELAYHWGEAAVAGHEEEAVRSAGRAAEEAVAATAHDAAVEHLRAARAHFAERDRIGDVDRMDVQLRLAEVLNMAGRLDEAEVEFIDAADQARRAGRADLLGRAALGLGGDLPSTPPPHAVAIALVEEALELHPEPDATRALLLSRLAERRHRIDPGAVRRALADEAVDIARRLGDDALLARVMLSRVRALHGPDAMAEMLAISHEVDRIATRLPDDALAVRSAQVRMNACFALGDLAGADQAARVTSVLAGRLRQPEYERLPLMWEAFRAMYEGRFDAGSAVADEVATLLSRGRHSQTLALVGALLMPRLVFQGETELAYEMTKDLDISYRDALLAWFSAEAGALDRARHHLDALGSVRRIEAEANWSWWQGMVAAGTAASLCGHRDLLAEVRTAIEPWAGQHATAGLVSYLGSGHHHLGVAELGLGRPEAAVAELEQAIVAHEELGARPFVALSRMELARALDRRGEPGDAARAETERAAALEVADRLRLTNVVARA